MIVRKTIRKAISTGAAIALALAVNGLGVSATAQQIDPGDPEATPAHDAQDTIAIPSDVTMFGKNDPNVRRATAVVNGDIITGTDLADAVRILLTRIANEGALPLDFAVDPETYDAWFRAKVQEALDDPRPAIPHAEVEAEFAARRAAARRAAARSDDGDSGKGKV